MPQNPPVHPSQHPPIHIDLTDAQKQQIVDYIAKTGHQPDLSLVVTVVQGKIAPAAVAVGAA